MSAVFGATRFWRFGRHAMETPVRSAATSEFVLSDPISNSILSILSPPQTASGDHSPEEADDRLAATEVREQSGGCGNLLAELESRQDEVLEALDQLDRDICRVLANCGVTLDQDVTEEQSPPIAA